MRRAAVLLETVIVHRRWERLEPHEAGRRCRLFLQSGDGLAELARSTDPAVAARGIDAVSSGSGWAELRNPTNVVVATALMNLPNG